MPLCYLHTNIPDKDVKEGVEERIAKCVAEVLNKPLERVVVVVTPGLRVFKLGSSEPACDLTISSVGVFDKERNPGYSDPIKDMLTNEFGLPRERISLIYQDLDKDFIGH